MKKRIVSVVVLAMLLAAFVQSGNIGITARAESLGLDAYNGWFSTAKAANLSQIQKVARLSSSQTNSEVAGRINDILFKATYRPTDIGGSDWVQDNQGSEGITCVYDSGLGTTVSWGTKAWGCFSYAMYVSHYVRGSKGSIVSIGKDSIPTVQEIKNLIDAYADPGEHIRYFYKSPGGYGSVHSVAYLGSDSEGFYFSSESGDGLKITVHYCTYSYFRTALRVQSGDSTLKIYDTNGGKDGKNGTTVVQTDVSSSNKTVASTSKPAPRYTPELSEYKESYSRLLMWRSSGSLMVGNDIRYMQACLYYLGYDIDIDGWYGSGSASVVKQFQTHYGLTADGDIGHSTWSAIEKAVANNPPPGVLKINTHPNDVTTTAGSTVKFSVSATGTKLSYQWYYKKSGDSSWTLWNGHTTASTSATANSTWNGMQVYCKVTDGYGKSVKSNSAVITLVKELLITQQPSSKTITLGDTLTLSVKAQGTGLSYQWYYKKRGTSSWIKWNNRTHASEKVTPNATWDGIRLYCKVTDVTGKAMNSDTAIITVNDSSLKILTQPKSTVIALGDSVTVSVKAQGDGLSYQWYYKKRTQTTWTLWTGRTRASETVTPNATWDGIQLYCKVKDSSGRTVNSDAAIVVIN